MSRRVFFRYKEGMAAADTVSLPIPDRAIFVWIGRALPLTAYIAVRSAQRAGGFGEVQLLTEGLAPTDPHARALARVGVRVEPVTRRWWQGLPAGAEMRRLWDTLGSPAARSNVLRLAALYQEGGVYLDTDTVVLRPLSDLRRHRGFCGSEPVSTPGVVWRSTNPARWLRSGALHGLRAACVRLPGGLSLFRRLEPLYHRVVSNAVLAAAPRHPLLARVLWCAARLPPRQQRRHYALGVHLLQRVTENRSGQGMTVLPPAWFFPVGPELAVAWFRSGSAARLPQLLQPETHVVHWYDSTCRRHLRVPIDRAWLRAHPDTAYARLASPHLA